VLPAGLDDHHSATLGDDGLAGFSDDGDFGE
jgi:hypothetical protein